MSAFTVSLFGHRDIDNPWTLKDRVASVIRDLAEEEGQVLFYVGRNGEFDECDAKAIKRVQNDIGSESIELCLVLPYPSAALDTYERYYDNIVIPKSLYRAHYKAAITLKNRWMVEHSDLVIVHVEHRAGGAYEAMKYAEKLGKRIINPYKSKEEE